MEKLKSKLIIVVIVIFGVTTFMSCDESQEVKKENEFCEVAIPEDFGITNPLKSSDGVFIPEEERIVEEDFIIQLADNKVIGTQIIELDEFGNIISLKISNNIFTETELDTNFLLVYSELINQSESLKSTKSDIADCAETCNGEGIKHPGWCKAGCIAELVVKIALAVVAALTL